MDCNLIPNLGCFGGRREYALNYTLYQGLTTAEKYPYVDKNDECNYNPSTDKIYNIDHYKIYENLNNKDL